MSLELESRKPSLTHEYIGYKGVVVKTTTTDRHLTHHIIIVVYLEEKQPNNRVTGECRGSVPTEIALSGLRHLGIGIEPYHTDCYCTYRICL